MDQEQLEIIADELGLTIEDVETLDPFDDISTHESEDGHPYYHIVRFRNPVPEIMSKIKTFWSGDWAQLSLNAFDQPEPEND